MTAFISWLTWHPVLGIIVGLLSLFGLAALLLPVCFIAACFLADGWDKVSSRLRQIPPPDSREPADCPWCRLGDDGLSEPPCACGTRCPSSWCQPRNEWHTTLAVITPAEVRWLRSVGIKGDR